MKAARTFENVVFSAFVGFFCTILEHVLIDVGLFDLLERFITVMDLDWSHLDWSGVEWSAYFVRQISN
jgi:GT2 family glycosyltransferase